MHTEPAKMRRKVGSEDERLTGSKDKQTNIEALCRSGLTPKTKLKKNKITTR